MRRLLRRTAIACTCVLGLVLLAAAIPVAHVEMSCRAPSKTAPAPSGSAIDAAHRRAVGDSYMTYPEWYIVHAYADLAGVTRRSSESGFDYAGSIGTFWSSLCGATRTAGTAGPVTRDQRITDYIIGLSFSLEMAVQGIYERSVGAVTAWTRGGDRTAEDAFNQRFLDDYAAFLQQTPWYAYPFKAELVRFWSETPFHPSLRAAERRVALSLEYGVKGLYAVAIGALAGASPADLTIRSVVRGDKALDVPGVTRIEDLGPAGLVVETSRYSAFTDILAAWSRNGTAVIEIAGNRRILTSVVARIGAPLDVPGTTRVFAIPLQARPGYERVGLDTKVEALTATIAATVRQGAEFEHAYDY